MNNAFRGVILAIALLGMAFMFFGMIDSLDNGSTEFTLEDLANALTAGLGMVSCAIIGGAALAGMTPSPPKAVTFPPQPGAVPPQGQPYPQPGAVPSSTPRSITSSSSTRPSSTPSSTRPSQATPARTDGGAERSPPVGHFHGAPGQ